MNKKYAIAAAATALSVTGFFLFPRNAFALKSVTPEGDLTTTLGFASGSDKENAFNVAAYLNRSYFNGWFYDPKHSLNEVLAIWRVESAYKPSAIRKNDGGTGNHAYGIGQVLGTTAGDFGITNPSEMLSLEIGAKVSMQYLKWSYEYLEQRLGKPPSKYQWIGAYNAGVGNVLKGNLPIAYLFKIFPAVLAGSTFN